MIDKGYVLNLEINEIKELMLQSTGAIINDILIKALLEGDEESTARDVDHYFAFYNSDNKSLPVDNNTFVISSIPSLDKNKSTFINIKKRKKLENDTKPMYLRIITSEDVYFNNKYLEKEFRIKLQ